MRLNFAEDILPVTDFRNNAADVLAQLSQSGRPVVLTQRGRASAVLIDVAEYQKLCDRLEELERREARLPSMELPSSLVEEMPTGTRAAGGDDLMRELEAFIRDGS